MLRFLEVVLVLSLLGFASCNTTAGLGEDLESAGDAIENTADDAAN